MARENFNTLWANTPTQFEEPTSARFDEGWVGGAAEDPPEAKWQNWWQNRVDSALQDLERDGAMEWLADVPYEKWALAKASDGAVYIAVQANTGADPVADDGTNWIPVVAIFAPGPPPVYGIRAWGNFSGMGGATLNAGGNVSVSRISNGRYQVTFSISMPDDNYSVTGSGLTDMSSGSQLQQDGFTPYDYQASGFKIETRTASGDVNDLLLINFQVVR